MKNLIPTRALTSPSGLPWNRIKYKLYLISWLSLSVASPEIVAVRPLSTVVFSVPGEARARE